MENHLFISSQVFSEKVRVVLKIFYNNFEYFPNSGMAIVISPLIALMMDQVKKLPREIPGVAYNSSLTWDEKKKVI